MQLLPIAVSGVTARACVICHAPSSLLLLLVLLRARPISLLLIRYYYYFFLLTVLLLLVVLVTSIHYYHAYYDYYSHFRLPLTTATGHDRYYYDYDTAKLGPNCSF